MKTPTAAVIAMLALVLMYPVALSAQESSEASRPDSAATQSASAQQTNVPPQQRQAEQAVERVVTRFGIGVQGGVGLDPEVINFGAHGTLRRIFIPSVSFRPGIEFGVGELTTLFGINLDVIYDMPGSAGEARWVPYLGAGPNFALSHMGFETDELDGNGNRFDFSDTDFTGGFNFIAGARSPGGMFFELKATAYGVSNIRFLAGYNF